MKIPAVVALFLLVVPTVAGQPFLQEGYDSARTGDVPTAGPKEYEIALDLQLPGARPANAPLLMINGSAYGLLGAAVPDAQAGTPREGLDQTGLFRVDLGTGEYENLVPLDGAPSTFTSDGDRFYIAEEARLAAYESDGSGPVWSWAWPDPLEGSDSRVWCGSPAVAEGVLYLACTREYTEDSAIFGDPTTFPYRASSVTVAFVARFDLSSGSLEWLWQSSDPDALSMDPNAVGQACRMDPVQARVHAVATVDDHVLVTLSWEPDIARDPWSTQFAVIDLDAETSAHRWSYCLQNWSIQFATYSIGEDHAPGAPAIAASGTTAYIAHDDLIAVDLESGQATELHGLGPNAQFIPDQVGPWNAAPGVALRNEELYVQSYWQVFRYLLATDDQVWEQGLDYGGYRPQQPLWADQVLYVTDHRVVRALEATTGNFLWKHEIDRSTYFIAPDAPGLLNAQWSPPILTAVSDGLLAFLGPHGHLVVLGRTPVSIVPFMTASDLWPKPGEAVKVDLSATQPGLDGGLEYAAEWGDGHRTHWQTDPVLEHAFADPGIEEARFIIRNEAGQRSVGTLKFDVGGSPPQELNFLQKAFARDNQDLTFGVLGIVVALAGGFIALGWRQTKRSRLQRELDAIDQAYEATKDDPPECEAALLERKAHCRGLLLDGKLEEPQFAVLANRIDELTRTLRVAALDDRFDFLPHGLVKSLKEMLADGRISAWEREHVIRALDENPVLTKRQKQTVRSQVDQWFERDTEVVA